MVNGPLTPPASTPVELKEDVAPPTDDPDHLAQIVSQNRSEIYQTVIPLMTEAIAKREYQNLVNIAEETDVNTPNDRHPSRLLIVAPLALGYLILDDLPLARSALIRLPDSLASLPLPRALMALITSVMNREHVGIYDKAARLNRLVAQPDSLDSDLAPAISNLLSAFLDHFRQRMILLLSKAYTSLPLSLACTYLSLPAEQIIEVAQEWYWSYDPSTQIISPKFDVKASLRSQAVALGPSSLTTFQFVADSVARLES